MDAGQLNKRVTFRKRARVNEGGGSYSKAETPTDILTVWCRLEPLQGKLSADEKVQAGRIKQTMDYFLHVRRSPEVEALPHDAYAHIDGVDYDIMGGANMDERNEIIRYRVEEGVAT